jgi:hypothetical protein
VTPLWAEIATDGFVVFERDRQVSRLLAQIRSRIASGGLLLERDRLPGFLAAEVDRLAEISKELRRDLELAFYGAEDLTPSTFYVRADATRARDAARWVVQQVKRAEV